MKGFALGLLLGAMVGIGMTAVGHKGCEMLDKMKEKLGV